MNESDVTAVTGTNAATASTPQPGEAVRPRPADGKPRRRGRPSRDEEVRELRASLEAARAEAEAARAEAADALAEAHEYRDKYLRERAELENHKKRVERTYADAARQERKAFLLRLLEVLDNLERALAYDRSESASPIEPDTRSLATGLRLTYMQFKELLSREGLSEVPAVGQQFDPALHEAVAVDEESDRPEGEIVAELQKGYRYGDELLRPARVKVAAGNARHAPRESPSAA